MTNAYRLYRTIYNSLNKTCQLQGGKRQHNCLNILAGFISGILQAGEVKLSDVADGIPHKGKTESKIMSLRRWLKNEKVTAELFYLPFIETLIVCLAKQGLVLIIDGSTAGRGCVTLMVSMLYKSRAIPLLWVTRKGKKGAFPEAMSIELIKAVKALIPEGTQVTCLGDGEFDGSDWLSNLEDQGWFYVCRTAKNSTLYGEDEEFTFRDICPERGGITEIAGVDFTQKRQMNLSVVAYWEKDYKDPIYLVTNITTGGEATYWYKKRFRIETLFSDFKGRGFNLNKSGIRDPERLSRLLIAVSLAYIWMIFLGELAHQNNWNELIHRTDRCDLSLFTMGKRLLRYFLREGIPLPKFCLSLTGQALM